MGLSYLTMPLNRKLNKVLDDFGYFEQIFDVIDSVINFIDSEIYHKLYEASSLLKECDFNKINGKSESIHFNLAKLYLKQPIIPIFLSRKKITFDSYNAILRIIICTDYAHNHNIFTFKDFPQYNLILENFIITNSNFNKLKSFTRLDKEFFFKLNKIRWDKDAKKLSNELKYLRRDIHPENGFHENNFWELENLTIDFLAASSGVNYKRNYVLPEDVINSYKTYIKMVDTNVKNLSQS
ncbi:MAG: hypothetical protein ACP5C3_08220 [Methanomicrobiales archaeon]